MAFFKPGSRPNLCPPDLRVTGFACAALLISSALAAPAWSLEGGKVAAPGAKPAVCADAGQWFDPKTRKVMDSRTALSHAADSQIVLLGETHNSKEDHLWQTHTLAGLHALHPDLVIGFEAFPRDVQPALDGWSGGALSDTAFLDASRWDEVWGYDADLYMPLFDFARQNRLPMKALNVDRKFVSRVGRDGWAAIAEGDREGLGEPAPASPAYREHLAKIYTATEEHRRQISGGDNPEETAAELPVLQQPGFARFVDAQLTWDRAMAEALAKASKDTPNALVVGVLGRGHVEYGYGVPHQLADLGIQKVTRLLPLEVGFDCEDLDANLAEAVFLVQENRDAQSAPEPPRLGVFIEAAPAGGVLLSRIIEGSVAEAAALSAGDIVLSAASVPVATPGDLVEIIARQAPGTWLPLDIRRGDEKRTHVAKFPASQSQPDTAQ